MSSSPIPITIPTDVSSSLLTSLAGGGIGAGVVACGILLLKCLQGRRISSKSGCISFEVSSPHNTPQARAEHFTLELAPTRTPVPSLDVKATVLSHPEIVHKENVAT